MWYLKKKRKKPTITGLTHGLLDMSTRCDVNQSRPHRLYTHVARSEKLLEYALEVANVIKIADWLLEAK